MRRHYRYDVLERVHVERVAGAGKGGAKGGGGLHVLGLLQHSHIAPPVERGHAPVRLALW